MSGTGISNLDLCESIQRLFCLLIIFINLKSDSQNKVLSDFTKLELKDTILELTSADGLEATSTNDLLNKALEVDFVDDPVNETCIVCNTVKNQKEFEDNIEICKKCFILMNIMQNVDYLLQILNRKENSSLSNFFKTL